MPDSNIIMYTTEDGLTKIETTFENDTVWLSIYQMAELFQRDKSVIGKHVTFREELDEKSTTEFFLVVQKLSAIYTIFCGLYGLRGLEIIFWIGRTGDFTRVIFYLICISP